MGKLNNIFLAVTAITGSIVIIRVGKDKRISLEKRDATQDFYRVIEDLQKHNGNFKQSFQNPTSKKWYEYTIKELEKEPKKDGK